MAFTIVNELSLHDTIGNIQLIVNVEVFHVHEDSLRLHQNPCASDSFPEIADS